MKSSSRLATPPAKPLLLFDGNCGFCRLWVRRWQEATGGQVDYQPFQAQELGSRFPEVRREDTAEAVHLLETDGSIYSGAEAVFRALATNPRGHWLLDWYQHSRGFASVAEWVYRFVAGHRTFFSWLTRLAWGPQPSPPTYTGVRWVFLRALGLIYLIAILSFWVQIIGLIGENGILPAKLTMAAVRQQAEPANLGLERFHLFPSLCWFSATNGFLTFQCAAGTALAGLLLVGIAPVPCLCLLWVIYLSLTMIGREFMGFQWDSLLLETGFLAIFLAPLQLWPRIGRELAPSRLALWLLRWLLFRLMLASGCVKLLSGDPTWRNLTALQFHYETQPLPTWIGWYAHQPPAWFQRGSTLVMFGIELLLPFLIFAPRRLRMLAGAGFILFQLLILATGNYCFFNLLTLALCVLLLDDAALRSLVPRRWRATFPFGAPVPAPAHVADPDAQPLSPQTQTADRGKASALCRVLTRVQHLLTIPVAVIAVVIPLMDFAGQVRVRMLWPRSIGDLYEWLAPFRSCNHYGLFAVMTTTRLEIIVEGSNDGVTWLPYEFKYKPGNVMQRPRFVEPHQPRLDWQMWFAALSDYRHNPWFVNFCVRLLQGDPQVLALLERNPFSQAPPRYLRAQIYEYHFTNLATRRQTGAWWRRELRGEYLPVISLRGTGEAK